MFLTQMTSRHRGTRVRVPRRAAIAAGVALTMTSVAACSSGGGVNTEAPVAATATITPSTDVDEAAILAAYREFFARQTEISMAAKEQRRILLDPFTTDPALERVLRGMFAAEELGEVGYGEPVVRPVVEDIDGDTATVTDCQDGRDAGRKKRGSGKITTRGMKSTKVVATAERGPDGRWRMATFAYPEEPC